ncbi:MAG: glutamate racemase [Eubacteriales bacterium]|nr:glutamate racemase [Eubacteriales bacterium]
MDNRPIGIFDSGLGGLTAMSALRELMPAETILYFGDTSRCPYGTKTREELRRFASGNLELLASMGAKAVIAACGTVSANAPEILSSFRIPVVNVIDPVVRAVAENKEAASGPVAVIATKASIGNGAFQRKLQSACSGREVVAVPCQDFVALCESGHISPDDVLLREKVREYLEPVKASGASEMILGCTHFGIISEAITAYLGDDVRLLSASEFAAREMKNLLEASGSAAEQSDAGGHTGEIRYYTSGDTLEFEMLAERILNTEIKAVHISAE